MNVEKLVVSWLGEHCGVPVYGEVPSEDEKPHGVFVTVERTGGAFGKDGIDRSMIAVQCWARSMVDASELAGKVASLAGSIEDEPDVAECSVNSLHRHPTAKQEPRYQVVLDMAVYV